MGARGEGAFRRRPQADWINLVWVGAGAVLRQGKPGKPLVIGKGAVVGMGAVVTKDVAAGVTVVGNPARRLVKS